MSSQLSIKMKDFASLSSRCPDVHPLIAAFIKIIIFSKKKKKKVKGH
jgi:hypothetical protein